jgi:hypothetical protein
VGTAHPVVCTALTPTRGPVGEPALSFVNGSSSLIDRTYSTALPTMGPPFSCGVWFAKTTANDTAGAGLWGASQDASTSRYQFDTYNGDLRWIAVNSGGSAGTANKSASIVSKRWHHALGVDITAASRYACLDGVASAQDTTSITVSSNGSSMVAGAVTIGAAATGWFTGNIAEVCCWNRNQYPNRQLLADHSRRFELYYPLRSRKWFTTAATVPTLSASTYKPGTLTTDGWQPRVTAS